MWQDDGEQDVFQWLMSEGGSSSQGFSFEEQQLAAVGDPMAQQGMHAPVGDNNGSWQHAPQQQQQQNAFGWADDLLAESPAINSHYKQSYVYDDVPPLTDDLGGAMDIMMGGPQSSASSAMHQFAQEAATGHRRRGTSTYYSQYAPAHPGSSAAHDFANPPSEFGNWDADPYSMTGEEEPYHMVTGGVKHEDHAYNETTDEFGNRIGGPRHSNFSELSSIDDQGTDTKGKKSSSSSATNNSKKGASSKRAAAPKKSEDGKMTAKSLAQRERNREAVRNCRKRKREYATKLKERETHLQQENQRLRLQLKLGSEEMQRSMQVQCQSLSSTMKDLLSQRPGNMTSQLHPLTEHYMQTHTDQGRNREEATKHIISRLLRQVEPTHVTKMYLWQTAQENSYFKTSVGLWAELRKRLGLTRDQLHAIRDRRNDVLVMCREIASVLDKLDKLHAIIMKRKRLSGESLLFKRISSVLSEEQLAKLIVFVHEFAGKKEDKWMKYLENFDKELDQEELDKHGDWVKHKPASREALETGGVDASTFNRQKSSYKNSEMQQGASEDHAEIDDDLHLNRHKSALVLKDLFERSEEELMEYAKAALSPIIDLYDPNTVRVIHGIDKVLKYIRRIRMSFDGLTAKEENFMTRKNVARGRWTLTGTYYGFRPNQKAKNPSSSSSSSSATAAAGMGPSRPAGKKVSFKVIIAYKFVPKSAQIQQLMVSWAALDVMRQLALLPDHYRETLGDRMKHPETLRERAMIKKRDDEVYAKTEAMKMGVKTPEEISSLAKASIASPKIVALPKLDQKLKEAKCLELTKLFCLESSEERLDLADDILDDSVIFRDANMGGAFSGPDECLDYIRRLRRAFATMSMTRHNFVNVKKRKRGKSVTNANKQQKVEKGGDTAEEPRTQLGCLVKGMYKGALVKTARPYEFNVTIFVSFNRDTNKISEVEMSWNATSIMKQLGVLT